MKMLEYNTQCFDFAFGCTLYFIKSTFKNPFQASFGKAYLDINPGNVDVAYLTCTK